VLVDCVRSHRLIGYNRAVSPTMHWRIIPEVVAVVVHTDVDPVDEDWNAYITDVSHNVGIKGVLVYTPKSGPSASQRARANAVFEAMQADIPTAVMTGSHMVRGIVTALTWALGSNIKAFTSNDFQGAVDYLELQPDDQLTAKVVLKQLAHTAGIRIEAFVDELSRSRQKSGD
jgi:hypothetical protein